MSRIVAMVSVWKRPIITAVFYRAIRALATRAAQLNHELVVVVAGSEGEASRVPAERAGFYYIETDNRPLGRKAQARLDFARDLDPDWIWIWGSDNPMTPDLIDYYDPLMDEGVDRIGFGDLYFYDCATARSYYWPGYPPARPESAGPGRMLSRAMLDLCGWRLWPDHVNAGLDGMMTRRLQACAAPPETRLSLKETGAFVVDLKTSINVTKISDFPPGALQEIKTPAALPLLLAGTVSDDRQGRSA